MINFMERVTLAKKSNFIKIRKKFRADKVTSNKSLVLQLHLTKSCNLSCKHCYLDNSKVEQLSLNQIEKIIEDFKELLKEYDKRKKCKSCFSKGHINITGGEPFIRSDIFEILNLLHLNRRYFSFAILTNGTLINTEIAKKIKSYSPIMVQVSIDGKKETHDLIRGEGNFEKTFKAVRILNKEKIKTIVAFTAHDINYKEFSEVARISRKKGAKKIWSDRLVPFGEGANLLDNSLKGEKLLEYIDIMKKEKDKKIINNFFDFEVSMNRSLQFLKTGDRPYSCSAGATLITILENGDILPCRRMPIVCGNVLKESLKEVYFNNRIMNFFRNDIPEDCKGCNYINICKGGARCIGYAITNDINKAVDLFCPLLKNKIIKERILKSN